MSIHNLSNDRSGIGRFHAQPSFLRDEPMLTLLRTLERYDAAASAPASPPRAPEAAQALSATSDIASEKLFDGGDASAGGKPDYRSMAQAMLARLDALRERIFGSHATEAATPAAPPGESAVRNDFSRDASKGWTHHGRWYSTGSAPVGGAPAAATPAPAPRVAAQAHPSSPSPPPSASSASPTPAPAIAAAPRAPAVSHASTGALAASGPIALNDGAATIADLAIEGPTGIVGDNATHVTTLNVRNVRIRSTNYGIYLGSCDNLNLSKADIACDPGGADSYSIRGSIRSFTSADSTFRSGIKAFRLYGVESGSSTRDAYAGDRLMLGGGYANEWGDAAPFHNFTFKDGTINVNSVEMYDDTSDVTFENMDFAGTGHISIQAGAHDIVFKNCTNLPQIRLYDGQGGWTTLPADASRNITVITGT